MRFPPWILLLVIGGGLSAQDAFQDRVNRAIERGRGWLAATQDATTGIFGTDPGDVGQQALLTLSLLKAGLAPDDPVVKRARPTFRGPVDTTYQRAVRLMLQDVLRLRGLAQVTRDDAETLIRAQNAKGAWRYAGRPMVITDNSCTQYAVLGLRAARNLGYRVPVKVWERTLAYVKTQITAAGGTGYLTREGATASMTAGSLSSLVIITWAHKRIPRTQQVWAREAVTRTRGWLERNWKPTDARYRYYTLYGIERAMGYSGTDLLGRRDWYREGADWLIANQAHNGSWESNRVSTAFALLFLVRKSRSIRSRLTGPSVYEEMQSLNAQARKHELDAVVKELTQRGPKVCPALTLYLADPILNRRIVAHRALRSITGQKLGYDPVLTTAKNKEAIARWRAYVMP
ncbi:MAG: hypothetical protein CMJ83_16065 [Planctomycetes bacterium]|nr:hypothetical protein [Planctomycetota bacterium]